MFTLQIKRAKYPAFYVAPKKKYRWASHLALLAQPLLSLSQGTTKQCYAINTFEYYSKKVSDCREPSLHVVLELLKIPWDGDESELALFFVLHYTTTTSSKCANSKLTHCVYEISSHLRNLTTHLNSFVHAWFPTL